VLIGFTDYMFQFTIDNQFAVLRIGEFKIRQILIAGNSIYILVIVS